LRSHVSIGPQGLDLPLGQKLSLLLGFCAILCSASSASSIHSATPPKLIWESPAGAMVGWAVRDAGNDSLLEGRSSDKNFTPASTQKLFTTWIALDLLGADKTFATELLQTGSLVDGQLHGDLIIKGGGDPSLGDSRLNPQQGPENVFATWTAALKKIGLKKITGCVRGDGSYLVEAGPHPASLWEDAGNYYAGIASGLSFNGNLYLANFSGAALAGKAIQFLGTSPIHTGIAHFKNYLVTGPTSGKDSAFILGGFPSAVREMRGTYPAGQMPFSIKGSLPNPAWTCAREFHDYLVSHGITNSTANQSCGDSAYLPNFSASPKLGTSTDNAMGVSVPGSQRVSAPLRELIRHTNQKSDNNYAAQLLALIGKEKGPSADWQGGLIKVNEYLDQHGFSKSEIHLKDGNGLSRYNWISPGQTALLLAYASRQKAFPDFQASLLGATATGTSASLDRYGRGWDGKLWVKTGTLEGVSTLAGYLKANSGRLITFAISVNNFDGKTSEMQKSFGLLLKDWAIRF
jgi:serine-type D-Ala-D-Ala carboxypeptidase/endopeptidase (penicillin-binding protein 4)